MKKIFLLITLFSLQNGVFAQIPQAMNYQAVARNANGTLLQFTNIGLRFSILDGGPSGTPQYVETQTKQTNQFGLFVVNIGQGTVQTGNFSSVSWFTGNKFLKVEMDATGGTNYTLVSTAELLSVPYALVAERLSVPPQLVLDDLIDVYAPVPSLTGQVLKYNGVTWAPDLDSNTLYMAGNGLSLSGDTFSLQPISQLFVAGNGIYLSGDTLSVVPVTDLLKAGNGISISNDTISVLPIPQLVVAGTGLFYSGDTLSLQTQPTSIYAGSGLTRSGDTLINTGDIYAGDDVTNTTTAAGDLRGGFPNPEVSGLLGRPIFDTLPGNGTVLTFDSIAGSWKPIGFSASNFKLPYADSLSSGAEAFAIHHTGTGNAAFFSADTGNAIITGNGNVGIGTLTPISKLDVNGDINTSGKIQRDQTGTCNIVPIAFGTVDAAGNAFPDATTANVTIAKVGLGTYDISISGEVFDVTKYSVSISLADGFAGVTAYYEFNSTLEVTTFDFPSGLSSDRSFSFQVYKK